MPILLQLIADYKEYKLVNVYRVGGKGCVDYF